MHRFLTVTLFLIVFLPMGCATAPQVEGPLPPYRPDSYFSDTYNERMAGLYRLQNTLLTSDTPSDGDVNEYITLMYSHPDDQSTMTDEENSLIRQVAIVFSGELFIGSKGKSANLNATQRLLIENTLLGIMLRHDNIRARNAARVAATEIGLNDEEVFSQAIEEVTQDVEEWARNRQTQ